MMHLVATCGRYFERGTRRIATAIVFISSREGSDYFCKVSFGSRTEACRNDQARLG